MEPEDKGLQTFETHWHFVQILLPANQGHFMILYALFALNVSPNEVRYLLRSFLL